tara:strand:+ start:148 stop:558 length:411 start_codon:yes stop_codon:yes gene_type:complete
MQNTVKLFTTSRVADSTRSIRHVFIRDLVVTCSIGIHSHEKAANQRVRLNLDLAVDESGQPIDDDIKNVICYEKLVDGVNEIIGRGHVNLVETLAENIAKMCLSNTRVLSVRVRVEKLDILKNAQSVGVEIERTNC